jgi:hypothetical protein
MMASKKKSTKKSMKLGGGGRFKKLAAKLGKKKGVYDPKALAAKIGREKYGIKKFQKMATTGRKRAAKKRKSK